MNRREFIKKALGTVVALAIPTTVISDDSTWFEGEFKPFKKLNSYYLGKGTLYFDNGKSIIEFPKVEFEIYRTPLEPVNREINIPFEFTLDEINQDNLKLAMGIKE